MRKAREWFVRGRDLDVRDIPLVDFQTHTRWSDGTSSVAEMIDAAEAKGLSGIALTAHVNAESVWYRAFVEEVVAQRARSPLPVYFGAEVAAADYDGGLKADPGRLQAELLLGVVHRFPKLHGRGFLEFDQIKAEDAAELEICALHGLTTNRHIDVLAHPGGTTFTKFGPFPVEWLEEVFCEARDNDIAVELNTKYAWDLEGIIELLRRVDPLVSLGSDAQSANQLGTHIATLQACNAKEAPAFAQ